MDKLNKIKLVLLCLSSFLVFFISCEKDNPTEPNENANIIGIWEISKVTTVYQGETVIYSKEEIEVMGLIWTLTFKADNTMEQTTNISGPLVTFPGTWSTSEGNLTMILTPTSGETASIVYEYGINDNILQLNWCMPNGTELEAEFTKQL